MTASTHSALPFNTSSAVVPAIGPTAPPAGAWEVHPAAALFPMMFEAELRLLADDIQQNGLREPIVTHRKLVLDGRNRLRACELAGIEPRFVEWDGEGSPIAFVLSRNLHRRHLTESQRSLVAARAKEMFKKEAAERERAHQFSSGSKPASTEGGDEQKSLVSPAGANLRQPCAESGRVDDQAATMLNVSARSVTFASRILESGDEQVIAAVDAGEVAVSDAAAVTELPKPQQREALEKVRAGDARTLRQAATRGASGNERDLWDLYRRFEKGQEKLCGYVDTAVLAFGGPNDHTTRVRDFLDAALSAMHDCAGAYGQRPLGK